MDADRVEAARQLERSGRRLEALAAYAAAGAHAEAARLARELGQPAEAARLYEKAGMDYEAASCHAAGGDPAGCLESLLRVRTGDPRFRFACMEAVRLAARLDRPTLELEQLLEPFIREGPGDAREIDAFLLLGAFYERHGYGANAREAYEKILAREPGHREAEARLASLGGSPPEEEMPDLPDAPLLADPAAVRSALESGRQPATAAGWSMPFTLGAVVGGRYRLEERLGAGGNAIVFRAHDRELEEEVALKVFKQLATDGEAEDRVKLEVKLSRQLSHPNVIRLHDLGYHLGFRYVSMELLHGSSLRQRMSSRLRLDEILDYLVQACAGIEAAHRLGIIHRDIKPENCFITREGVLKVVDFGLAKVQSALGVTTSGVIAGTPAYMAPEQIRNFSGVGRGADIYALGVVAYEALTGRLPFHHTDSMSLLMMHLSDVPAPPRDHNPEIPAELQDVVLRLLAKEPEQRFASCAELGARLGEIRERLLRREA